MSDIPELPDWLMTLKEEAEKIGKKVSIKFVKNTWMVKVTDN
jgi:hypothetical protein